jgi:hypothetical protein
MGAWSDLSLTATTLKGIAPVDLHDAEFDEFDSTRLTTEYLAASKRRVEASLTERMPRLVALVEGPTVFLDDAADIANIGNLLQDLLAYSFLMNYYSQERFSASGVDTYMVKMQEAKMEYDQRVQTVINVLLADEDFILALEGSSGEDLDRYENIVWVG